MKLQVKKLTDTAILPLKKRDEDEGWDIFTDETRTLPAGRVTKISTGIACAVEDDRGEHWGGIEQYWLQIEGRSGLASKGIFPVGGIVDHGYTGEICVMLANMGDAAIINKGDKIAQLVIRKHYNPELVEVEELGESDRGEKGFGSSGK